MPRPRPQYLHYFSRKPVTAGPIHPHIGYTGQSHPKGLIFGRSENPENRRIVLSPRPIDAESRAVSKKVLTLDEAQKTKKLERFEIFAGRPAEKQRPNR